MSLRCRLISRRMTKYLDGTLNDRKSRHFEAHIASCEACRADLRLQQMWLDRRNGLIADQAENGSAPGNLAETIMAAVERTARETGPIAFQKRRNPTFRLARWPGIAGAAAAVLVFVLLWQGFPAVQTMLNGKSSADNGSRNEFAATTALAVAEHKESVSETTAVDQASGWLVDAERLVMQESGRCYSEVLNLADNIRIAVRHNGPAQTVILVPAAPDIQNSMHQLVKEAITSCANPVQIEIIRSADLAGRLNSVDQSLYDRLFSRPPTESHWILVLIGE